MKDIAAMLGLIVVGFVLGFFAAIELPAIDPPCLLNNPPCVPHSRTNSTGTHP